MIGLGTLINVAGILAGGTMMMIVCFALGAPFG